LDHYLPYGLSALLKHFVVAKDEVANHANADVGTHHNVFDVAAVVILGGDQYLK
jgi:hypothetical protein